VNGIHDLGGMHGFGPVERAANEPVFHAEWERRVFAITRAARTHGIYNIDESRRAIEQMEPARYLAASYYERWLASAVTNLIEKGVITRPELEARMTFLAGRPDEAAHGEGPASSQDVPELAERVLAALRGQPNFRRAGAAPKFSAGDRVLTRNVHPRNHTRLPRYARGKLGVIHAVHGSFVFPDTNAHGLGEIPHPLYTVRFDARVLWSSSAEAGHESVFLDLWENYLLPAPEGATL